MDKKDQRVSQDPFDVNNWLAEIEIEFEEISEQIGIDITLIFPIKQDSTFSVEKDGHFDLLIETRHSGPISRPRRKLPPSPGPPPNRPLPPLPNTESQIQLSPPLNLKEKATENKTQSRV